MASTLDFPLHGASVSIVGRHSHALINVIQSKYGCKVDIDGVDSFMDPGVGKPSIPVIVPEKRFSHYLYRGLNVSVWKADLTTFPVDAVVNAANKQLQHYSGLAKALCDAGGPDLQRESTNYIDTHGPLSTGDAVLTKAGCLPCKMVIHAVGPCVPYNPDDSSVKKAAPLLKKAVFNILAIAEKNNIRSVAIPALSSGLFHFPLPECANIIVSTVKQYFDYNYKGASLREVYLVNNDEPSVSHMERACCEAFSYKSPSYSQAAQKPGKGAAQTSPYIVQIGKVNLILRKGQIEEQQADVIVSTTAPDGNLSGGQISRAILKKAGKEIQDEMYQIKQYNYEHVIATSSYRLQCKEVYHTLCVQKGTKLTHESPEKILFSAISKCMRLAASKNYCSIVFPAIGTGNLNFSKDEVSQIMICAAVDFAKKCPKVMDIHFVIYPYEEDTFRAFHDKMEKVLKDNMAHSGSLQGFAQPNNFGSREGSTSKIRLSSTSAEKTLEAKRWLEDLFRSSSCVTIRNNFIQHFGEKEYQQLSRETKSGVAIVEVLVNGCARIQIKGNSAEDVIVVVLQVEDMLCQIQQQFVKEEEHAMTTVSHASVSYERKPVERYEFTKREDLLRRSGLKVLKVEKVENHTLKNLYELKSKQLNSSFSAQKMYQRISAQFCNMVSHIGFQREYAPPDDPKYGDGIYFAETLSTAMSVWKDLAEEEYVYIVEAQVLTGNSTRGSSGLIVPPAVGIDPRILFGSVKGSTDTHVVFSGYQALPEYIIICEKTQSTVSQL